MSSTELVAKIEALLFIYGDPISTKKIASVLKISEDEVGSGLEALRAALSERGRGLTIAEKGNTVQLTTKPEFSKFLEDIVKGEFTERLTPAALEALSIICYTAPATRAEIDYIRGVNSSFILRSLSLRGLVERNTEPKRGHAYVYSPSFDLMKHLGLARTEDLPEFEKFRDLVRKFSEGATMEDQPEQGGEMEEEKTNE